MRKTKYEKELVSHRTICMSIGTELNKPEHFLVSKYNTL